jgi:hypothetical protein
VPDFDFGAYTVDESMDASQHAGSGTMMNQLNSSGAASPSKSLAVLWFAVLALYWFLGWFFKGARSR